MTYKEIDYSKLNDQIVKQAYNSFPFVMTQEDINKMIQEKFDRARQFYTAINKVDYKD